MTIISYIFHDLTKLKQILYIVRYKYICMHLRTLPNPKERRKFFILLNSLRYKTHMMRTK